MSDPDVGNPIIRHAPFVFVFVSVFHCHLAFDFDLGLGLQLPRRFPLSSTDGTPKDPSNTIHNVSNCRHAFNTANTDPRLASDLALDTSATPTFRLINPLNPAIHVSYPLSFISAAQYVLTSNSLSEGREEGRREGKGVARGVAPIERRQLDREPA
jgi:hypothetical protein